MMVQNGNFQIRAFSSVTTFRVSYECGRDNTYFVAVKGASGLLIEFSEFSSNENIAPHTSDKFMKDLLETKHAYYFIVYRYDKY